MTILNLTPGSEVWKQTRLKYITGTDMAMVTREASWDRLKESKINPSTFQSEAMARGNALEDEARDALQGRTGVIYRPAVVVNKDLKILVSLDGLAALRIATCEIKIPEKGQDSELWKKAARGKIPRNYLLQMQAGMMVSGAPVCHYWVYDPTTGNGLLIKVEADSRIHNEIEQSVKAYWNWLNSGMDATIEPVNNRTGEIASKAEEHYLNLLAKKAKLEAEIAQLETEFSARRKVGAPVTKGVLINITETPKTSNVPWKKIVQQHLPDLDVEKYREGSNGVVVKVEINDSGKAYLERTKKKAGKNAIRDNDKAA